MAAARLIILATLAALAWGKPSSRILGGDNAATAAFPYAVSVRLDNAHICGGTLIGAAHILTAGHCVAENDGKAINKERLSVRVGSTNQHAGGKLVEVGHVSLHPQFTDYKNDLAILTLANLVSTSDRIRPIPYAKMLTQTPATDASVVIAGWGEQANGASPYKLQHTTQTVASNEACSDAFSGNDESIICLSHNLKQGSCRGDAGNGAVLDGTLVAVSNFVIGACGARYPDVFANVAYFGEWIDSVLAEDL